MVVSEILLKARAAVCVAAGMIAIFSNVSAQMSISTFGATDAQACFEDARDDFTTRTDNCDEALNGGGRLTKSDKASTYVNRGIIENRAGQYSTAQLDFDRALEISPNLAEAFLNRGNSFYLLENYKAALDDYEQSLGLGLRKAFAAWYNIGLIYDIQKRPDQARTAYQNAADDNPSFSPAQEKLMRYSN